jgi:hypothetical protein
MQRSLVSLPAAAPSARPGPLSYVASRVARGERAVPRAVGMIEAADYSQYIPAAIAGGVALAGVAGLRFYSYLQIQVWSRACI